MPFTFSIKQQETLRLEGCEPDWWCW